MMDRMHFFDEHTAFRSAGNSLCKTLLILTGHCKFLSCLHPKIVFPKKTNIDITSHSVILVCESICGTVLAYGKL